MFSVAQAKNSLQHEGASFACTQLIHKRLAVGAYNFSNEVCFKRSIQ